jgi:hypothetical protein
MGLVLMAWIPFTAGLNPWLGGLGGVAVGGLAYALGVVILKVPEVKSLLALARRKLPGS